MPLSAAETKSSRSMANPPEVDRAAAARAAVAARRARAGLKKDIAGGAVSPLQVLDAARESGSAAATLRVPDFLGAIPAIGRTKAERIMKQLGISPVKRVGGLGVRQRAALREFLSAWQLDHAPASARLLVLAGPTAVGKGTVAKHIQNHFPDVHISVSATTRAPRPGEHHGEHYFFVSEEEFDRMIADGELLEWARVHNANRYGTPRGPVDEVLRRGGKVLLEIDIQGARRVRAAMPNAQLVFLEPPSWDELVRRLSGRGTESAEEQARRLETAKVELSAISEFDSTVVNDDVATAAQKVVDLMYSKRRRSRR